MTELKTLKDLSIRKKEVEINVTKEEELLKNLKFQIENILLIRWIEYFFNISEDNLI